MKLTKKHLMFALIPVFALSLLAGGVAFASTDTAKKHTPFVKIAEAIATKFNLATSDVQTVIDETMKAERAEMEKNRPEPIAQAVKDGKLTQAQADLIKAKREEIKTAMESTRDSLKNMTQTERDAFIKTQKDALKQWATDNNIPEQYIMFIGGHGPGRGDGQGPGGPKFRLNNTAPSATDAETATN